MVLLKSSNFIMMEINKVSIKGFQTVFLIFALHWHWKIFLIEFNQMYNGFFSSLLFYGKVLDVLLIHLFELSFHAVNFLVMKRLDRRQKNKDEEVNDSNVAHCVDSLFLLFWEAFLFLAEFQWQEHGCECHSKRCDQRVKPC